MTIALAMRTANRTPKRNYVGGTLRRLQASGADLTRLHLCLSDPDPTWLLDELGDLPRPILDVPGSRRSPNANALAQVADAVAGAPDWVLLLEDDLAFCADFLGSVERWLAVAARADRHVYRLFGFTRPPRVGVDAYDCPLAGLRASQAILLCASDARAFLAWGTAHLHDWRRIAPWKSSPCDPSVAFDKFVAAWALTTWPGVPGVISHPYFVNHIGDESSLHRYGARNDRGFAGAAWSFRPVVEAVA